MKIRDCRQIDYGNPRPPSGLRWKRGQHAGYAALFFVVIHLVALGYQGWLAPQGWQWGIPPVSLVAVVVAMVPLLVKRKQVHDMQEKAEARKETNAENQD